MACRTRVSLIDPDSRPSGGRCAQRRGSVQRGIGPRSRCRSRMSRIPDRGGRADTTPNRRFDQVHRLRTVRLAALLVGLAMVAAACGGGDDEGGGGTSGGTAQIQPGGTLNYAADQEPTGFNENTSKDNGTSVYNVVINVYPQPFHAQPDFTVKMDEEF